MDPVWYFLWICHCERHGLQQSSDGYDAYCAGYRGMDNHTEQAMTA